MGVWTWLKAPTWLALAGGLASAQPIQTSVCELMRAPADFRNRIVTVRGEIDIAFEDFALRVPDCAGRHIDFIWLEYGSGPKKQPTVWCCGDMVPRDSLVVVQDRAFHMFDRYLTSKNGKGSHRYRTIATITGRYEAVETGPCKGDITARCPVAGGFGHLGTASARLVIQRVQDVEATPVP